MSEGGVQTNTISSTEFYNMIIIYCSVRSYRDMGRKYFEVG